MHYGIRNTQSVVLLVYLQIRRITLSPDQVRQRQKERPGKRVPGEPADLLALALGRVRIGIDAPESVRVLRKELREHEPILERSLATPAA